MFVLVSQNRQKQLRSCLNYPSSLSGTAQEENECVEEGSLGHGKESGMEPFYQLRENTILLRLRGFSRGTNRHSAEIAS